MTANEYKSSQGRTQGPGSSRQIRNFKNTDFVNTMTSVSVRDFALQPNSATVLG
jgi:phage FluMu protein gp41